MSGVKKRGVMTMKSWFYRSRSVKGYKWGLLLFACGIGGFQAIWGFEKVMSG
jgi:hypothetical protein